MKNQGATIERTLNRREFLRLSGTGVVGAALLGATGCGGRDSANGDSANDTVTFTSFGGSYQSAQEKAWLKPYSKKSGIKVRQDSPTDYAKLQAMVENNQVTWDVVDVEEDFGLGSTTEFLEPLDYSVINKDSILEGYANKYRVADILFANVLAYNADKINGTPENWADFFDLEKFPGSRGVYKNPSQTFEVALLGDGVPPENLYPLDVDRALAKLDTIRDQIIWWDTGAQSQQLITDGEVTMASAFDGRVQGAVDNGAPAKIQWNQNLQSADYLVVPKGTPNKEQAMKLIAHCVSGDVNYRISKFINYAPINKESISKLDPTVAKQLTSAHQDVGVKFNSEWWNEHREKVLEKFNQWLIK